jgi:ornithine carbamoyltransferase
MEMAINLKGRHFLKLEDFTPQELSYLLDLSQQLKAQKYAGVLPKLLEGKNIALLFEKPSTRTRCAFVVACVDLGAHPEYLGKDDIQLGKKESVADTAKVLGRMFDGIEFRGFKHETVEELAKHAGVPVWNGLTDKYHPTQILADFLTIREHFGRLRGIKMAYVGDGRNNMGNTLLIGCAKMGMDFRIVAPESLWPEEELVKSAREIAEETGASLTLTEEIDQGVQGVDVIYTDVWVSMGEEDQFAERIRLLKPYQVNMEMIRKTGNEDVIFLHCLPSFHNLETEIGRRIYEKYGLKEMEVTDEVFQSKHSLVFDQAENRLHTIKAVLAATL